MNAQFKRQTSLHSFAGSDGSCPDAGVIQATNGELYGTTSLGGADNDGTVFAITVAGALSTLHSFDGSDGANFYSGLIQAPNGELYGVTPFGGLSDCMLGNTVSGCGTVFEISVTGKLKTLHYFDFTDGAFPSANLLLATDGNLYGTNYQGGPQGVGNIFKIASSGAFSVLHNFDTSDGVNPNGLSQDTDGTLFGTTLFGGTSSDGTVFSLDLGLGPFVMTEPASGIVGTHVRLLGTGLSDATSVEFNGTEAAFTVVSASFIETVVPKGATTGLVQVATPSITLLSDRKFSVRP